MVDFTEDLCKAFNERPKLCIRVNTLLTNKEELLKQLSTEGVNAFPGRLAQEALYFLDSHLLINLSFNDGLLLHKMKVQSLLLWQLE